MATQERLKRDYEKLEELNRKSSLISAQCTSSLLDEYRVDFYCKSIESVKGGEIKYANKHTIKIKLKAKYPFVPPYLECTTLIFHPNINKNGEICIQGGNWDPTRHLDEVCIQVGEMLQYKNFNVDNSFNADAAEFARKHWQMLSQLNPQPLIDKEEPEDHGKDLK